MSCRTRLKTLAKSGQRPFAVVLTCSDSRVPTETIFDQKLGDLYVVRVAGNIVAPSLIASIEFAVLAFETPLVLVVGHTGCGAIQAAFSHYHAPNPKISFNLLELVQRIIPAIDKGVRKHRRNQNKEALFHSTWENVRHSVELLKQNSHVLSKKANNGSLKIVGSLFELESGKVLFR